MDKTIVIMMGLQGSGKSTFYKTYLSDDFVPYIANFDDFKCNGLKNVKPNKWS